MSAAVLSSSSRTRPGLRSDERLGLIVAGVAHVAIIAALAINALRAPTVIPPPERVTVNLSDDVGLTSTAAQVAPEAKASVSDRIGEEPTPPKPAPPKPEPKVEKPKPAPPKPAPPKPVPAKAPPKKPVVSPKTSSVVPKPAPRPTTAPPVKKPGASRIGDNFLDGKGSKVDANAPVAASQIGAADRADLSQAITRQLRPNWVPPNGLDAEKLATTVVWRLNPDGSLAGAPSCQPTQGVTDSNRPQAARHCELAIRAIRTTNFNLPPKFYNLWKKLTWEFNKDLSQ